MAKNNFIVNIAETLGTAIGAFNKARTEHIKKTEFVAGLADQTQWGGGSLANLESAQMRAVRNSWFFTGINTKALDLSSAKFGLFYNPSGIEDDGVPAEGHPFMKVIRRPNPYMGKQMLFQYAQWWLDLQGEAFWFIEPERNGIKSFWPLPSNAMDIEFTPDKKNIQSYILKLSRWYYIDPNYIVHFKYPNPFDFFRGMPPLIASILTIDADLAMKMWNGAFFGKDNVMPNAIISLGSGNPEQLLEQKDVDAVTAELTNEYSAIKRKTVVTNANSMAVAMLGYNSKDMDFLAGMQWNKEEILWTLGVPAGMIDKNSTEANAKVGNKIFKDNMWGIKGLIAGEVTSQALPFYSEELEMRYEDDRVFDRELELREAELAKDIMTTKDWGRKYFDYELKDGEVSMNEEKATKQAEQQMMLGSGNSDINVKSKEKKEDVKKLSKAGNNTVPKNNLQTKSFDTAIPVTQEWVDDYNISKKSQIEFIGVPPYMGGHLPMIMVKHADKRNKSQRTTSQLQSLKNIISKHGITKPIKLKYCDGQLEILDGVHRVEIAQELDNIIQVPVVVVDENMQELNTEFVYDELLSNGYTNVITGVKSMSIEKSIDEEFRTITKKAKNFLREGKITKFNYTSDAIDEQTIKSIVSDIQGVENYDDIGHVLSHWKDFISEGNTTKANNTFRLWSEFEQPLANAVFNAFQNILNYLLGIDNEAMFEHSSTWSTIDNLLADAMKPIFQDIASKAVSDTSKMAEFIISYDLVNSRAREIAVVTLLENVVALRDTTKRAIQRALQEWRDSGKEGGLQGLLDKVQFITDKNGNPIFDMARAERIAKNEAVEVYAIATETVLVENGYPPAMYKPKAHAGCRCYIQPGVMPDGTKVIVWYTVRDEMVCKQELETPWGMVQGCKELHRTIVSEGKAGQKWDGNLWEVT